MSDAIEFRVRIHPHRVFYRCERCGSTHEDAAAFYGTIDDCRQFCTSCPATKPDDAVHWSGHYARLNIGDGE